MRSLTRIGWAIALALASGYCAVEAVLGVATGSIDGPARGRDYISASDNAVLFWGSVSMHGLIAIVAGATAHHLLKRKAGYTPA